MILRALAVWCLLLLLAIGNGLFRESVLVPRLGGGVAHVISTLLLAALVFGGVFFTVRWLRPETPRAALAIGLLWVALTLAFEFGFGRVQGKPWEQLLADYDVANGRIWPLVLLVIAVAPWAAARLRGLWR